MNVVICLEKYSDWLEANSIFAYDDRPKHVTILYIENQRNTAKAVEAMFFNYKEHNTFTYISCPTRDHLFVRIGEQLQGLSAGDILAAPFIRYRNIWAVVPEAKSRGVITVHLSESFPDSFGRLGYRLGFRLVGGFNWKGFLKQVCVMPYMYWYALRHQPDICYYNMYPKVSNPFVRTTIQAAIPELNPEKKQFILQHAPGDKRPLLISGFGYNLQKMVAHLGVTRYIATSKDKEIIIDGRVIPLDDFICAEEVLLSGCVNEIIGYDSTAMCWAYLLNNVKITCYEAKKLSEQYGFLNGYLTRRTMKKCGLTLLPQCQEMVD
jgi:hypothetical protein